MLRAGVGSDGGGERRECDGRVGGALHHTPAPVGGGAAWGPADGQPERLVIDLSWVEFIDSTALGVLIEARTKLANRRAFLLAAPAVETRRALEISGLDRHFTVHESLDSARAASVA